MHDLEITWPGGVARFTPSDSPVRVGRSAEAAIPLTEGSVSRRHLELLWDGSDWTASDASTHGTFDAAGSRLATSWVLDDEQSIRLGGLGGVELQIRLQGKVSSQNGSASSASTPGPLFSTDDDRSAAPDMTPPPEATPAGGLFADRQALPPAPSAPGPPAKSGSILDGLPATPPAIPSPSTPSFETPTPANPVPATPAGPSIETPSPITPALPSTPAPPAGPSTETPSPITPALPSTPAPPAGPSIETPSPSPEIPSPVPASAFNPPPVEPGASPQATPAAPGGFGSPATTPAPPAPPGPASLSNPVPSAQVPGAPALNPSETIVSDATLRLNVDGQDFSFLPGAEVTVGRDPSCLVQLEEKHSLVSRRHLRISFRDNNWWLDDFSSKGTFVDGKPIKGPYKAEGAFIASLGDDNAGTPLRVITTGEHRAPKSRNGLAIAALAAALIIPLAALTYILTNGGGAADAAEPDFASAKQATVMIFSDEGGYGSGFFVSDNLIVTNQHVAALSPQMWVAVSRSADEPAQVEYATELVQNHPFLDIAVLRVSNRAQLTGNGPIADPGPVGDINIQPVTIGDSNAITLGDQVFSTGFPGRLSITSADDMGDLRLPPVSATSGEAASFSIWPGCSNPDFETFIPAESPPGVTCSGGGDVNKGVLVSTFSSGQGASGSAVFRNNEVVAVVFAGSLDEANASLNITTAAFSDWLQEIIDAQG